MITAENTKEYVREHVRIVPNFPKAGIQFLDITTAVKDNKAMQMMTDWLYNEFKDEQIDYVAGIESRGFIFGSALAYKLNCGFLYDSFLVAIMPPF